ncbi:unnamed protein product [Lactuca virosa]|uniref:Uncharacterized protein n=1 Tax=Lactuca virosa TaxID=75947 RepID=A0AAU9M8U1_9ASTR|nr:unnamed protein product [Lactuca virosa]
MLRTIWIPLTETPGPPTHRHHLPLVVLVIGKLPQASTSTTNLWRPPRQPFHKKNT